MPVVFLCIFRFFRLLMSGHGAIAMENAALRGQLAAFQRKRQRPMLTAFDRLFWVGLSLIWNGWRVGEPQRTPSRLSGNITSSFPDQFRFTRLCPRRYAPYYKPAINGNAVE